MIQRMRSNLWIIAIHATLIPLVFFFCLLSWSMGATLPAFYAATCISAACTLVGLAAIVLDGVCYHYGIGERLNAFFDRCEPVECEPRPIDCPIDAPQEGVQYRLTGGPGVPCISNGNTWSESEVTP